MLFFMYNKYMISITKNYLVGDALNVDEEEEITELYNLLGMNSENLIISEFIIEEHDLQMLTIPVQEGVPTPINHPHQLSQAPPLEYVVMIGDRVLR